MPAIYFHVRWPDAQESRCYSPSLIVQEYFEPGTSYLRDDFLRRAGEALHIASERVRAKYGFACSQALDQLAQIEAQAIGFAAGTRVTVTGFSPC